MSIAHAATDSKGDSASAPATLTVTKPTGVTLDSTHVLTLAIGSGNPGATVGTYTAPSGWTAINTHISVSNGSSPSIDLACYWALGNAASLGFTKSGTVATTGWVMLAFSGVDTTTPIDATGTTNSTTGNTTLTTNAVTIATANAWHLIGFADWQGGTFSATSFTNAESPTANETASILYNTTPKSTGSTGTVVVTSTIGGSTQCLVGMPFALRPAAGGGGATDFMAILGADADMQEMEGGFGRSEGRGQRSYSFPRRMAPRFERSEGGLWLPSRKVAVAA